MQQRIRAGDHLQEEAAKNGMTVYTPSIELCGDNAAMIAALLLVIVFPELSLWLPRILGSWSAG